MSKHGMSFNIGKAKLKDGSIVNMPRTNFVPGEQVLKEGKVMENGTYETEDGRAFTIASGVVGKHGLAKDIIIPEAPVVIVEEPVVVIEPVIVVETPTT